MITQTPDPRGRTSVIVTFQHFSTEVGLQTVFEASLALFNIEYLRLMYYIIYCKVGESGMLFSCVKIKCVGAIAALV